MIGRDHDQRFLRMFQIKIVRFLHGIRQINHFPESCRRIIHVAGIINQPTFHHQKESLLPLLKKSMALPSFGPM